MIDFQLMNVQDQQWFGNVNAGMDVEYDNLGQVKLVEGVYFLNQNIQKNVMTVKRDTNLYPAYGSVVDGLKGQKIEDSVVRSYMLRAITEALADVTSRQETSQEEFDYTDEELYDSLLNVQIVQSQSQKTKYDVSVSVLTKSGETSFNFIIDKEML